jgi:hypothetical protein
VDLLRVSVSVLRAIEYAHVLSALLKMLDRIFLAQFLTVDYFRNQGLALVCTNRKTLFGGECTVRIKPGFKSSMFMRVKCLFPKLKLES